MTKPKDNLSELRQQRADVKRRLAEVGTTLATLQAELAMVDYRIASHRDYVPVSVQRPVMYEDFFKGVVSSRTVTTRKKYSPINLDGLDLEDLDIS